MLQPIQIAELLPREALEKNMRVCLSLIFQMSIGINTYFTERRQKKQQQLQKIIIKYFYLLTRAAEGVFARTYCVNTPRKIMLKFKTPYFFHILLRCCLCNSVLIWAKVFSGQRLIFSATLNLLYHLLFFNLCHACCIVMVHTVYRCFSVQLEVVYVARAGSS